MAVETRAIVDSVSTVADLHERVCWPASRDHAENLSRKTFPTSLETFFFTVSTFDVLRPLRDAHRRRAGRLADTLYDARRTPVTSLHTFHPGLNT